MKTREQELFELKMGLDHVLRRSAVNRMLGKAVMDNFRRALDEHISSGLSLEEFQARRKTGPEPRMTLQQLEQQTLDKHAAYEEERARRMEPMIREYLEQDIGVVKEKVFKTD